MFSPQEAATVLILGHNPDQDLLVLLRGWLPEYDFECQSGAMSTWLNSLWTQPPDGLLLFTESMDLTELHVLAAWLQDRKKVPVLAVVGQRALLGAEALLAHPGFKILPIPWTVAAIRSLLDPGTELAATTGPVEIPAVFHDKPANPVVHPNSPVSRRAATDNDGLEGGSKRIKRPNYSHSSGAGFQPCRPASELGKLGAGSTAKPLLNTRRPATGSTPNNPTAAFAGDFLDGLVERFRDPLASLSGHLQLLRVQAGQPSPLLEPALHAAQEIEASLDALYLASDSHPTRPSKISGEHLAIEALKEAQRAGLSVQLALNEDFLLRADQSLVRAGLQCARVLLSRFGGAESNELVLHCKRTKDRAVLQWQLAQPVPPSHSGAIPPPPFLGLLLQRFAERLGAEPVLETTPHQVPQIVGLAWPAAQTMTPVD
ncbi:MAG: hypothetical protein HQ519_07205 [Planctomycetes bacterium]|nr:hypothetical protein [Planctomycetota bacterium]